MGAYIAMLVFGTALAAWGWSRVIVWSGLVAGAFIGSAIVGLMVEHQHSKARAWSDSMHEQGCAIVEMRGTVPSAFKCPDGVIYR